MSASFEFTAGALVRRHARSLLKKMSFLHGIRYMENKGFFESEFIVKGETGAVNAVRAQIIEWQERMER